MELTRLAVIEIKKLKKVLDKSSNLIADILLQEKGCNCDQDYFCPECRINEYYKELEEE